jgi:restriction system protein
MDKKMWMVRAGRGAQFAEDFEQKKVVAIGWAEIGLDLTQIKDKKKILELAQRAYPDDKKGSIMSGVSQIYRFCFEFQVGDRVISYNNEKRIYTVGTITSEPKYKKNIFEGLDHYREVKWDGLVDRDKLSVPTKNSIGSISTLFQVSKEAQNEIESLLKGIDVDVVKGGSGPEIDALRQDILERSKEFIKDKLLALDWEEMQELVAGVLRALGYKTKVSSHGPDRGKDIIASRDGLGLENPRIYVEVKHREKYKIEAPMIRSFIGGRRQGDSLLYVSTGGFAKEAYYEAERSNIPLTLLNADNLVELIVQNYEKLDNDTRATIPLIKLYWPV